MNRMSLSTLYRRLTRTNGADAALLDASELAAAADGTLAADRREQVAEVLAASPAQADAVRMLRDLASESEALAADIARTTRETTHRRHHRGERRVAASRRWFGGGVQRWAAAAACLVAVAGAWTLHQSKSRPDAMTASAEAANRPDVIFSTRDGIFGGGMDRKLAQHGQKSRHEGDRLFHGDFSG